MRRCGGTASQDGLRVRVDQVTETICPNTVAMVATDAANAPVEDGDVLISAGPVDGAPSVAAARANWRGDGTNVADVAVPAEDDRRVDVRVAPRGRASSAVALTARIA